MRDLKRFLKLLHGDAREAHENQMRHEFQVETGGSYDMERFQEWYRGRLYSEEGLKMLARQESQKSSS